MLEYHAFRKTFKKIIAKDMREYTLPQFVWHQVIWNQTTQHSLNENVSE